ncbi:hypothetical protein KSS87_011136 [Heliosperma pusillum]|nr:hypothetical protein KSS87_011136 [Heliosperma pusillum]
MPVPKGDIEDYVPCCVRGLMCAYMALEGSENFLHELQYSRAFWPGVSSSSISFSSSLPIGQALPFFGFFPWPLEYLLVALFSCVTSWLALNCDNMPFTCGVTFLDGYKHENLKEGRGVSKIQNRKVKEVRSLVMEEPLKVLEFYSGVGGMRYSLLKAGVNANVVEAFEINDVANHVYQHNFQHRPFQGNIQSLTVTDLDKYQAHVWLLSPPCQPYTRQGLQKDSSDARAFSFLNILELIPQLSHPPLMLFVENVVGFETSDTHSKMIEVLTETNYVTQEFILSPLQFEVPYSRPRYFCLAKRKPLCFKYPRFNNQLLYTPSPLLDYENDDFPSTSSEPSALDWDSTIMACEPVQKFLEFECHIKEKEIECNYLNEADHTNSLSDFVQSGVPRVGSDGCSVDQYLVPLNLIDRWGSAMDIVYADSKRCCCFTKSYYRYVKGTGSLLATIQWWSGDWVDVVVVVAGEPELKGKVSPLEKQGLRYFTPREVANLHSFPKEFGFPDHISIRQRYALLGNSLSIAVVAPLIKYLVSEPLERDIPP